MCPQEKSWDKKNLLQNSIAENLVTKIVYFKLIRLKIL